MWVDSRGILYFSAGNTAYVAAYNPAIYQHIYIYKPGSGFGERTGWRLQGTRAIETGQCISGGAVCYLADDQSRIYRFTNSGPSWAYVGRAVATNETVWVFHVAADGKRAYVITTQSTAPGSVPALYEYDLASRTSRRLCAITGIDPAFAGYMTGTPATTPGTTAAGSTSPASHRLPRPCSGGSTCGSRRSIRSG